jgi:hypothetical protein
MSFSVDGVVWPVECKIARTSEVRSSDISGWMMDGSYFNDVEGQYLSYDVELVCPYDKRGEYAQLYEVLTAPVDGHSFVMPYNEGAITLTARVESVGDLRYPTPDGGSYWAGVKFSIAANGPTRYMDLDEVLTRGRAPLPELSEGTVGDAWIYTAASGWVHTNYPDYSESYW